MKSIALNSPTETALRDLLEDRDTGVSKAVVHAQMTLRLYKDLEGISYDELIQLATENQNYLDHMTPQDPAFETLLINRNNFYKVAAALNDLRSMGRYDHMLPVRAMVNVGNIVTEANFWIPKMNYHKSNRDNLIRSVINDKLSSSSNWRNCLRHSKEIDFVEL